MTPMNSTVSQDFSYDPFDPAVMADPLPYYRVLRDQQPVYYVPTWDVYALSRFLVMPLPDWMPPERESESWHVIA